MQLKLSKIKIDDVVLGSVTEVEGDKLVVNKGELVNILEDDRRIEKAEVSLARPGEKVRIIPVKDVIEPRYKAGDNPLFPGSLGEMEKVGSGRTKVLEGVAVVTTGEIVGIQEGLIDMWGKGAEYTPFSQTINVVLDLTPVAGIDEHDHESALRLAGLKAAAYLGQAAADVQGQEEEVLNLPALPRRNESLTDLPKVGYVKMLIAQGLLHDTYVYGVDAKNILPTIIHPNEVLDGALVSGNCVAACDKITTYQHQNNSIINDLYRRHGEDISFQGVVLSPEVTTLEGKNRNCQYTASLIETLGCDGVIISEEGYGNPDSDLLQICKLLEDKGIKTVLVTDECAGQDGFSQSLADSRPEAKAVVSTGNVSHPVSLPPAEKILGYQDTLPNLAGGAEQSLNGDGGVTVELNAVIGSTSEIGYHNLSTELY